MRNGQELAKEAAKMDNAIQAANERMVYVTGDKEAIRAYERRKMALSDYVSTINYARDEGYAKGIVKGMEKGRLKGREEGIEKGRIEGARNLKALGVSVDIISKATGLPPEKIEKL
jgi:predicted transposase/invertase (TIGR01784 family)